MPKPQPAHRLHDSTQFHPFLTLLCQRPHSLQTSLEITWHIRVLNFETLRRLKPHQPTTESGGERRCDHKHTVMKRSLDSVRGRERCSMKRSVCPKKICDCGFSLSKRQRGNSAAVNKCGAASARDVFLFCRLQDCTCVTVWAQNVSRSC